MQYLARRQPTLATLEVRGLRFQLYRWPGDSEPPLVLLHGWGDTAATYQFIVDQLPSRRSLVAFDARGFGCTEWPQDGYWFADYLGDLEAVLNAISPNAPVDIIGHSMGGNVAMLYAGVRPERVRRLMNLEGFGLQPSTPDQAPQRYRDWLDQLKHGTDFASYADYDQLVKVLARRNPRTPADRLQFIARAWGRERGDGRIELRADPKHKRVNPVLYQREQAEACWRAIAAPTLIVIGGLSESGMRFSVATATEDFARTFPTTSIATIAEAGHMLHHEQPEKVAELIEEFFR
jgi:pimeloyl-ACP methyl ester carboxylesterase